MKKSREHAQRLQKLYRALKRDHSKIEPVSHDDPVDAPDLRRGQREGERFGGRNSHESHPADLHQLE